jgi:hypothetical protein
VKLHMDQILVDDRRGLEGRVCEQVVRRAAPKAIGPAISAKPYLRK